jgi:hypothetical protein
MKILLALLMVVTFSACAHKKMCSDSSSCQKQESCKKTVVKPEVCYNGYCPMGLTKKLKVKGDHRYNLEYKGKHYIFSSPEARDSFMSKIDHHIKKADTHWEMIEGSDRLR